MQNAEEGICSPVGLNGISKPRSRSIFPPFLTRLCFRQSPFARFFVSDCMFVCFVRLQRNKGGSLHSATVKKLSQCAHCIADANRRIKGTLRADKEGLMPTSKTSDSHHWWFACLPGTEQNKMAPRRTLPQYGCIVWRWAPLGVQWQEGKRRFGERKITKEKSEGE